MYFLGKAYHATKGENIVNNCVEVLCFIEVVDLKQIDGLQSIAFTTFQIQLNVFPLHKE